MGGNFKFSTQISDFEFFEPHKNFWQKAILRNRNLEVFWRKRIWFSCCKNLTGGGTYPLGPPPFTFRRLWTIIGPTWLDIFKLGLLQMGSFALGLHSLKFAICFYGDYLSSSRGANIWPRRWSLVFGPIFVKHMKMVRRLSILFIYFTKTLFMTKIGPNTKECRPW